MPTFILPRPLEADGFAHDAINSENTKGRSMLVRLREILRKLRMTAYWAPLSLVRPVDEFGCNSAAMSNLRSLFQTVAEFP